MPLRNFPGKSRSLSYYLYGACAVFGGVRRMGCFYSSSVSLGDLAEQNHHWEVAARNWHDQEMLRRCKHGH
jgi:hypothetical protein